MTHTQRCCKNVCYDCFYFSEPNLLADLSRRVEEAEREFQAQDLDQKLKDLEAAKQRQVIKCTQKLLATTNFVYIYILYTH